MTRPARVLVPLLVAAAAAVFCYLVRTQIFPFVLAAAFAYLLNPAVAFFEGEGFRRLSVVVVLYIVVLGAMTAGVLAGASAVSREAAKARAELPVFIQRSDAFFKAWKDVRAGRKAPVTPAVRLMRRLDEIPGSDEAFDYLEDHWQTMAAGALQQLPSVALWVIPIGELAFLVPFIAFFFLVEGPDMLHGVLDLVPSSTVETLLALLVGIDDTLGSYLRGLFLEAFLVGLASFIGLWAVGLDFAFQVSLAVGITNLIPYVGPVAGALLGGALAIYQWGSLAGLAKVLCVCVGVKFFDDWVLQPVIIQSSVEIHPVLVLFSLMAGGTVGGFWGLLFAVPTACMIKVALEVGWDWYRSQFGVRLPELPSAAPTPLL